MPKTGNVSFKLFLAISPGWRVYSSRRRIRWQILQQTTRQVARHYVYAFTDQSTGNPNLVELGFWKRTVVHYAEPHRSLYSQPGTYTVRLIVKNDIWHRR